MNVLDLCCCAGGASAGYVRAGHTVLGVDIHPQPTYPYKFLQWDALDLDIRGFDFIHASPPCQAYSPLNAYNQINYPDIIHPMREMLVRTGIPFVIENVMQAPLINPVKLCGPMFGLKLYRHRGFEAHGFTLEQPQHARHYELCSRNGYLPTEDRPFMSIHGGKHSIAWTRKACEYMQTPWMITVKEVCESIPPAYTEYIGQVIARQL
jgi:DNA (cytosine-5)-methyltransferase 1